MALAILAVLGAFFSLLLSALASGSAQIEQLRRGEEPNASSSIVPGIVIFPAVWIGVSKLIDVWADGRGPWIVGILTVLFSSVGIWKLTRYAAAMEALESAHRTQPELQAGLDHICSSPKDEARLELIVRRPSPGEREVLESAELCTQVGLVGDNWGTRGSSRTEDGNAHPDMQINIMNTRVVALVAGPKERWPLAGDQLYVDMDLSPGNMPPGTRLSIGEVELEVTDQPHKGCLKFGERFGTDALQFVSSDAGKSLNLRGINARVVKAGVVREGDVMRKALA